MVQGFIDSASVFEVAALLRSRHSTPYEWAWTSGIATTCALIRTHHLTIAPSPGDAHRSAGIQGLITESVGGFVAMPLPSDEVHAQAMSKAKAWGNRWSSRLRDAFEATSACLSFEAWLEEEKDFAWVEHARRTGGLFNEEFIPQISRVLCVDKDELRRLRAASGRPQDLNHFRTSARHTPTVRLLSEAYVVSGLLRARYHEAIAKGAGQQVLHHPLRRPALPAVGQRPKVFGVSNTEFYLTQIIIGDALSHRRMPDRVTAWAENMWRVRKRSLAQDLDLRSKPTEDKALEQAVGVARNCDVPAPARWVERAVDMGVAVGAGALAGIVLHSWPEPVLGAAGHWLSHKARLGATIASGIAQRTGKLRALARCGPGRLSDDWQRSPED
jgi:hypothetical protein